MPSSLIPRGQSPQVRQESSHQNQPLKNGQIVFAVIKKNLPNQMAEVQIGGLKVVAKLTSPISAGERQWLKVTETPQGTELKAVASPGERPATKKMAANLLDHLALPKSEQMRSLVTEMVKQQWPINQELLSKAAEFIASSSNKQEALSIIRLMISKGAPFTVEAFKAFQQGNQMLKNSLSGQISELSKLVKLETSIPSVNQVAETLSKVEKPLNQQLVQWTVSNLIQTLGDQSLPSTMRATALQSLQQLQVIPPHATLLNWNSAALSVFLMQDQFPSDFKSALKQLDAGQSTGSNRAVIQNELTTILAQLQQGSKPGETGAKIQQLSESIQEVIKGLSEPTVRISSERVLESLLKANTFNVQQSNSNGSFQLMELLGQIGSKAQQTQNLLLNSVSSGSSSAAVQEMLTALIKQAEGQVMQQPTGKMVETVIRQVIDLLGIDYEGKLNRNTTPLDRIADSLKPQLLALISDPLVSVQTKEAAENVLSRFNGQALLSSESGPLQQMMFQLPFSFMGQRTDVTMQWTGRKQSDGTLDPDHARILFYLNLSGIKETVIDMQVQKRVISIDFYNERDNLAEFAEPMLPLLKSSIEKKDYQLSSVKFLSTKQIDPPIIQPVDDQLNSFYSGVDIRV